MIPSLAPIVEALAPAFTQPSALTNAQLLLAWVMCLGRHTLRRTAQSAHPDRLPDHSLRHGLDAYYNFFERSAWQPRHLANRVGVLILTRLKITGTITLLVDDTLSHKRGRSVWGLGWFRDAVASTQKRVATASGHNWVVLAIAVCVPFTGAPILALPLLARLHRPGKGQPGCAELARQMLGEVLGWWPDRRFTLVGDGAYASGGLLGDLDGRVAFVGRMRGDAAVHDPQGPPPVPKGRRGRKPTKGPRLPAPREAAKAADRQRPPAGAPVWQDVLVTIYGRARELKALTYEVVWPRVTGARVVKVVVVRDPSGRLRDCYLFTTDLAAGLPWVIENFAWRWAIEVVFRASKQVMDIEGPQHWCEGSVGKVAPWVWSMQSVIMVWYITSGYGSAEAAEWRARLGDWDSEWSLRHMLRVLRHAIMDATIDINSAEAAELREMAQTLKNWVNLAA
jgi:hypothetical protein